MSFIYQFTMFLNPRKHRRGVLDYFPVHTFPIIWVYHNSNQLVGLCIYSHIKFESHLGVNFTVYPDIPSARFKEAEILK